MGSIAVALIGGVVTLVGVVLSNSRSRAAMEVKIDELPRRVEKHNGLVEWTYRLERDTALARRDVDALEEGSGRWASFPAATSGAGASCARWRRACSAWSWRTSTF